VQPTDDKQEMQRRRFEMERSAPPAERDEGQSLQSPSAPHLGSDYDPNLAPSAPMLDDDDEGLVDAVRRGQSAPNRQDSENRGRNDELPVYQR
jgi:hypothetical protein